MIQDRRQFLAVLRHFVWVSTFVLLAPLAGCTSTQARPRVTAVPRPAVVNEESLWQEYAEAVNDAQYPEAAHIDRDLVAIVTATDGLVWNADGKVLMVTWTKAQFYQGSTGKPYVFSHGPVWLTAVPFVKRFCESLSLPPDGLRLRLEQHLGLPPNADYDAFVEVWVDPATFFRPCADPEITDGECELNLTTQPVAKDGTCPWASSFANQTSKAFVTVSQAHLDWMCSNWTSTYTGDPKTSYPWTALGFTYDWGDATDIYGESEFVAPKGTTVVVQSITPTADYCRRAP